MEGRRHSVRESLLQAKTLSLRNISQRRRPALFSDDKARLRSAKSKHTYTGAHILTSTHHTLQLTASKPMKRKPGQKSASIPGYLANGKTRPTSMYHAGQYGKSYIPRILAHLPLMTWRASPPIVAMLYPNEPVSLTNPQQLQNAQR